ncbi:hypothetical protein PV327_007097 [Microctonus hyperodae]|uniref:Uncharacterized protein n=1 Tax=Microctonus hyperodae TaxID=165561 RepID=A0AA39F5P2_MICHY|nr:hypothetical protein PV327_007097 [Microctonus hyperodae]
MPNGQHFEKPDSNEEQFDIVVDNDDDDDDNVNEGKGGALVAQTAGQLARMEVDIVVVEWCCLRRFVMVLLQQQQQQQQFHCNCTPPMYHLVGGTNASELTNTPTEYLPVLCGQTLSGKATTPYDIGMSE